MPVFGDCRSDEDCVIAHDADVCCACKDAYPVSRVASDPCLVRVDEAVPEMCTGDECFASCLECREPIGATCERGVCTAVF